MIANRDTLIAALAGGTQIILGAYAPQLGGSGTGAFHSTFVVGHRKGSLPTGLLSPALCTHTTPGAIPLPALTAGNVWYVGALDITQQFAALQFTLLDRLSHLKFDPTVTTTQSFNLTRPVRSTTAVGVNAWIEWHGTAGTSVGVPTYTVSYTNSDGVGGRTGIIGTAASPYNSAITWPGIMHPMQLAAGDVGVSSVQSITAGTALAASYVTGLVLTRSIVTGGAPTGGTGQHLGFYDIGGMPLGADPCLFLAATLNGVALNVGVRMIQG